MRVLHLITWLNRGGIEKWLLGMARLTRNSPISMDFCCKGSDVGQLADEARATSCRVLHCPMGWNMASFAHRLRAIVTKGNYDVVHNHLQSHSAAAILACRNTGVPVVSSFHNTHFPGQKVGIWPGARTVRNFYSNFSIRYALRRSAVVTGCSESVVRLLRQLEGRDFPAKVLYYGVELPTEADEAARVEFRRKLDLPAKSLIVAHVGRFVPQKNHRRLWAAFQLVHRQLPMTRLVLVGDGPLRKWMEREVAQSKMKDVVRFLGLRDDVPRILARSDLFLFPSNHEGFGIAALEANAAGIPVVGSKVPGLTEAVVDGETADLVEGEHPAILAEAAISLLSDPIRRKSMGERGRHRVEQEFSNEASFRRLQMIYESL